MNYLKFYNSNRIAKFLTPAGPITKDIDRLSRIGKLAADYGLSRELATELVDDDEAYDNFMADRAFGQQNGFNNLNERLDLSLLIAEQNPVSEQERSAAELRKLSITVKSPQKSSSLSMNAWGQIAKAGTGAIDAVDNALMGDKNFGAQSLAIDAMVDTTSLALISSGNPYAIAAGFGLKGANFLTKAGGQTVQGYDVDIKSSGYGNLGHKDSSSSRDFGALIGLRGLNAAATQRKLQKRNEEAQMALKAANVADTIAFEQEARMNSVDNVLQQNQIALDGGIDTSLLVAKKGGKLYYIEDQNWDKINKIIFDALANENIVKAKNGAKLESIETSEEPNVIPDGALHKNKNNLDLEGITPKGIPVVTIDDQNAETFEDVKASESSILQHAEIEKSEIIFNKELTLFIENMRKLWHEKDNNDDSICLEAGMRLAKEIIENTEDNTDVTQKAIEAVENENS